MVKGIFTFVLLVICALRSNAQTDSAWTYGYLTEKISVPTERGELVYPVGTRVLVLSENDGKTTVAAQDREFVIENGQISRNTAEVQKLQEENLSLTKGKRISVPSATSPADQLRSLERRGDLVKAEMDRAFAEMHNTPHKNRPRTLEDRALNERHDAWKRQYEELHLQYTRILDQERQLRHEMK